jgi:hypothetical protein
MMGISITPELEQAGGCGTATEPQVALHTDPCQVAGPPKFPAALSRDNHNAHVVHLTTPAAAVGMQPSNFGHIAVPATLCWTYSSVRLRWTQRHR